MKKKIILFLFTLVSAFVNAGKESYVGYMNPQTVAALGSESTYDGRYEEMLISGWESGFYNHSVSNKVWIGYKKGAYPTADESVTVSLKIEYWTHNGSAFVYHTTTQNLELSYDDDPTAAIEDMSTYSFSGAHRIKIKVLSITGESAANIYVKSLIEVDRSYLLEPNISNTGFREPAGMPGYLEFFWDEELGAEYYDLEWTYVSNHDFDLETQVQEEVDAASLEYDFYQNSTRVRINTAYYRIPKIFNKGYVVFRVRAIGKMESIYGFEKEGNWNIPEQGGVSSLEINAEALEITSDYEEGKNWVHSAAYTDHGRRFDGITFVDGLGFARQSVSANAETGQVVYSNVYYDRIGRAVVSDLPTPENSTELKHIPEFNQGVILGVEDAYGYQHYDYVVAESPCLNPSFPFSESEGAGKYYSQTNPNKEGANVNIPDADGYAFSQVEYMNDQTGRIRYSGGYGSDHQIDAHSTRLYYDVPLQSELNLLFGTDVGLKQHYQRKITIDPNGQSYVEYFDLAGRVVAHCLVGDNPENLERLANNPEELGVHTDIVYSTLDEQVYDQQHGIASMNYVKTVVSPGSYDFTLDFAPASYTDNCLPEEFCYECMYELDLEITSIDCPSPTPVYQHSMTFNGDELSTICEGGGAMRNLEFSVTLGMGQYNISKTLRVSEGRAMEYWCHYVENLETECRVDYTEIYNELYDPADLGCNGLEVIEAGEGDSPNACDVQRAIMRADMSPGGQYGIITSPEKQDEEILSVYTIGNVLPNGGDWKTPEAPGYTNSDGSPAKIYLQVIDGLYHPAVDNEINIQSDVQGEFVYPEHLLNVSDFQDYFEPAWADALVKYHPERCYLQFCEESSLYYDYINELDKVDTYDEACSEGWLGFDDDYYEDSEDEFFLNSAWLTKESWFNTNYGIPAFKDRLDDFITLSSTVEPEMLVFGTTPNLFEYSILMSGARYTGTPGSSDCSTLDIDDCDKEKVWALYKQELKKIRYRYYLIAQTAYVSYPSSEVAAVGGNCAPSFNGCIGNETYDPTTVLEYGMRVDEYGSGGTSFTYTSGPCFNTDSDEYSEKIRRFPNLPSEDEIAANPYYLPGSTDPYTDVEAVYTAELAGLIASECETNCEAYVDEWMERLAGCTMTTGEEENVRDGLLAVCMGGCDATNMGGASTISGSAPTPESFEEVLIDVLGIGDISELCTSFLISEPRPYGQNLVQVMNVELDECGCDKIKQAEADYVALSGTASLPNGVGSIEDMLAYNEGIAIEDAQKLLCACDRAIGETGWTSGDWTSGQEEALAALHYKVAPELTCTAGTCQNCTEIAGFVGEFHSYFGKTTSGQIADFKATENYSLLLTNFLNNELGFHLSEEAYEAFLDKCSASEEEPVYYTEPTGLLFRDLLDVVARRGFLTATDALPHNLLSSANIVYINSFFPTKVNGSLYWTDFDPLNTSLVISFGTDATDDKTVTLDLPPGADFGFEDIIGIRSIRADKELCESQEFVLEVKIISCGEIQTRVLLGHSTDLKLVKYHCDGSEDLLCDDLDQGVDATACYKERLIQLNSISETLFNQQIQEKKEAFLAAYIARCAEGMETESLEIEGNENYYQYTLYYYDQAGNLVKTVAPKGVFSQAFPTLSDVDDDRAHETANVPVHDFESKYVYNSYNQPVETFNPDQEGGTYFLYDFYGRLVASQNPAQQANNTFSYTLFDPQGRPVETGQVEMALLTTRLLFIGATLQDDLGEDLRNVLESSGAVRTEVHLTHYDTPLSSAIAAKFKSGTQSNLRLRVASVLYFDAFSSTTDIETEYATAIHYSYDAHGNVIEQLQDVPALAPVEQDIKSTQYDFELISGNVNAVRYQANEKDRMTHRYTYDKMERLRTVYTSTDDVHEAREAHYYYFDHGPLARVELGEQQVQASDYAYTINGWLKGVNSTLLQPGFDTGKDGIGGYYSYNASQHQHFGRDLTAYGLGYFSGDYKGIGSPRFEAAPGGAMATAMKELFNGNIAYTTTAIDGFEHQSSVYSYDQLQRLTGMRVFRAADLLSDNDWSSSLETDEYQSSYSYDENGNLLHLERNATTALGLTMDDFDYDYPDQDLGSSVFAPWNRLDRVQDNAAMTYSGTDDIKDGQSTGNYTYDALGQLTADEDEGLLLYWRLGDKKLLKIEHDASQPNSPNVEFVYNPFGQRVLKIEKARSSGVVQASGLWTYTYYSYDANGQVMAVYSLRNPGDDETGRASLSEQHIYGAGRLGMLSLNETIYTGEEEEPSISTVYVNTLGRKRYELSNHLGNVNAVINDRKILSEYTPEIITFEEMEPTVGVGTEPCGMNNWYNNSGTSVSLEHMGNTSAWKITSPSAFGGSNMRLCFVPGETYTIQVNVKETSGNTITLVLRDYSSNTFLQLFSLSLGLNVITYNYPGGQSGEVRLQFQNTTAGYMLIDDLSIKGDDMAEQYSSVETYSAVPIMKADYYPFGMTMPGRIEYATSDKYRYAYNGMEVDPEIKGDGNSYTTEFRQYDPRIGRWMSLDPMMMSFPWMSPYVAFDNDPVFYTDPYGLESGNNSESGGNGVGEDGTPEGLPPGPWKDEVTVVGFKSKIETVIIVDGSEIGTLAAVGNAVRAVENMIFGRSLDGKSAGEMSFGVELKTADGRQYGNSSMLPKVKPKNWKNVWTIPNMDELIDIVETLDRCNKLDERIQRSEKDKTEFAQIKKVSKKEYFKRHRLYGKGRAQKRKRNIAYEIYENRLILENKRRAKVLSKSTLERLKENAKEDAEDQLYDIIKDEIKPPEIKTNSDIYLRVQVNTGNGTYEDMPILFKSEEELIDKYPEAAKQNGQWWLIKYE